MLRWVAKIMKLKSLKHLSKMTRRTTRSKLKHQSNSALSDLREAAESTKAMAKANNEFVATKLIQSQKHLTYIAALGYDSSPYIADNLPVIITYLDQLIKTLEQFDEGL